MHITHPPQIPSAGITRDVRLRFLANAAFAANITFQNLLDTILFAATATSGFDLFQAVRINSVEVWAAAVLGTASTVAVTFDGATVGAAGDLILHTDTSMGIQPAHVKAVPAPRTQAGQFQPSGSAIAFLLEAPSGAVIDLSMTLRQPIDGNAVAAQNVLVAATAGVVYLRGLDGLASASTKLAPQGTLSIQ
jgi:hypothetical protein